jgi:hypothetical protein
MIVEILTSENFFLFHLFTLIYYQIETNTLRQPHKRTPFTLWLIASVPNSRANFTSLIASKEKPGMIDIGLQDCFALVQS